MSYITEHKLYHTQEKRANRLISPIRCTSNKAWLGYGYYFWLDENDAHEWGNKSKIATGYYEIYETTTIAENCLDTVFNEKHYIFWLEAIEKALKDFREKNGREPDKTFICNYIMNVAHWDKELDGILFDDKPTSNDSNVLGVPFRKRIQLVLYKEKSLGLFKLYAEGKCDNVFLMKKKYGRS